MSEYDVSIDDLRKIEEILKEAGSLDPGKKLDEDLGLARNDLCKIICDTAAIAGAKACLENLPSGPIQQRCLIEVEKLRKQCKENC